MQAGVIDQKDFPVWCFPGWAKVAGIVIAAFGLIDYLQPGMKFIGSIGLWLAMAGIPVVMNNADMAKKYRAGWLAGGYLSWVVFNILAVMLVTVSSGLTREFLWGISFLAPTWIVFGAWFAYYAHQVKQSIKIEGSAVSALAEGNASAMFRASLVWIVVCLLAISPSLFHLQVSDNQAMTFGPLHAEFMTTMENGAVHGKLGFYSTIQEKMDKALPPAFSAPLLGMLWFPGLLLLLPLGWLLVWKKCWRCLAIITGLSALALISIPLQIKFQYGLPAFGSKGFIQPGFWLFILPVALQIWALRLAFNSARPAGQTSSTPVTATIAFDKSMAVPMPGRSMVAAVALVVIWSALLPFLMRTPIESLLLAAKNRQPEKFAVYLEKIRSADPKTGLEIALCEALDKRHRDLVVWLLTHKPDLNSAPSARYESPLWWALRGRGDLDLMELLLQAGADPNQLLAKNYGDTPLGMAISLRYPTADALKCLRILASHGVDLNAPVNYNGHYPVEAALCKGSDFAREVVPELIRLGADPCRSGGENLFYLALTNRQPQLLKTLIDAGLSPAATDKNGNSFLHLLVMKNRINDDFPAYYDCAAYIPGVINSKNEEGQTPLHLAVERNDPDCVDVLLKLKADPGIENSAGLTPRQLAEQKNYSRILRSFN